jgi:hypothetical protein
MNLKYEIQRKKFYTVPMSLTFESEITVTNTASSDPWRPSATVSAIKRSADMIAKNQALERPCK